MGRLGAGLKPGMPGASGGTAYLKGLEETQIRLNKELNKIEAKSLGGLVKAASFIRNKTEHEQPLTPKDYGNLIASWFVVTADKEHRTAGPKTFKGPNASKVEAQKQTAVTTEQGRAARLTTKDRKVLIMGYGADYAGYVHEFIPGIANFTRPGSKEKWLETHVKNNMKKIVQIVKDNVQIK